MSIRESPSGKLKGLARLLFGGGNDAGGFPITNLGAPESPGSAARLEDVTEATQKVPIFTPFENEGSLVLTGSFQTLISVPVVYRRGVRVDFSIMLQNAVGLEGAPGAAQFTLVIEGVDVTQAGNFWEFSRAGMSPLGRLGCVASTFLDREGVEDGTPIVLQLRALGIDVGGGVSTLRVVPFSPPAQGPNYMIVYGDEPSP